MSNFRPTDLRTGFLMPPSVAEWLVQRHLARFVAEVVAGLDLRTMSGAYRGSGSASYHPAELLSLLVYGYPTGVFSSRKLERAAYDSVAMRFHCRERPSGPRHHRDVSAALPQGDRGAARRGIAIGARDGRVQHGHGGAGRDRDSRECLPAQRVVL